MLRIILEIIIYPLLYNNKQRKHETNVLPCCCQALNVLSIYKSLYKQYLNGKWTYFIIIGCYQWNVKKGLEKISE